MLVRFALAALLALVLVTQLGAPPAGAAPQGELLFRDDFEDEIKDDWCFPGDEWKIEDECFVTAHDVPEHSLCWATLEDLACPPDLSLKTAVVWRSGSVLLVLRTEDERSVACLVGVDFHLRGGCWFEQDEDGNWSLLATYERDWGERNVITLEAQGNKLTLLVDGDKVSSITLRSLPRAGCVRVAATANTVLGGCAGIYELKASSAPMLEYIEVRSLD